MRIEPAKPTGSILLVAQFLAHLSLCEMVSFCDRFSSGGVRPSVVCPSVVRKLLLQMTSPHKPLSQFHPNFTGMFLWWSPLKIVQRMLFHAELWLPWQPKEKTLNIFF
jgi:hypothetical protein